MSKFLFVYSYSIVPKTYIINLFISVCFYSGLETNDDIIFLDFPRQVKCTLFTLSKPTMFWDPEIKQCTAYVFPVNLI